MNNRTPSQIARLPLTDRDKKNNSCCRRYYHVYLSLFFDDLSKMPDADRKQRVMEMSGRNAEYELHMENESIDSTDTAHGAVSYYDLSKEHKRKYLSDVMRAAGSHWKSLSDAHKKAHKKRTNRANRRRIAGKFDSVPAGLVHESEEDVVDAYEDIICDMFTNEWSHWLSVFKTFVTKPRITDSSRVITFANEVVTLQSQMYKPSMRINPLILPVLFGRSYEKLEHHELIRRARGNAVMHVASRRRMRELFTLEQLSIVEYSTSNGGIQFACGKIITQIDDGRSLVGFILEENESTWTVKMENNEVKNVERLFFDYDTKKYQYNVRRGIRCITEYWPVRFSFNKNGYMTFTLNSVSFDDSGDCVAPTSD